VSLPRIEGPFSPLTRSQEFRIGKNRASGSPNLLENHQKYHLHEDHYVLREQIIDTRRGVRDGFWFYTKHFERFYTLDQLFPQGHYRELEMIRYSELTARILSYEFPSRTEIDRSVVDWFPADTNPHLPIPQGIFWDLGTGSIVARSTDDKIIVFNGNTNLPEAAVFMVLTKEEIGRRVVPIQAASICICNPTDQHTVLARAASPLELELHFLHLYEAHPERDVPFIVGQAIQNTIR